MNLMEAIDKAKSSYILKVVINHKFSLLNCTKAKWDNHETSLYLIGYMNEPVEKTSIDYSHLGYKTYIIYVNSNRIERNCMYYEDLWYDKHHDYLKGGKTI